MSRPNILIIAGDSEFGSLVMNRWHMEREVPSFTLISTELWNILISAEFSGVARSDAYDLVILGPLAEKQSPSLFGRLESFPAPAIHVSRDAAKIRSLGPVNLKLVLVADRDGWLDEVILLSNEILRRVEAVRAARRAEQAAALSVQPAALGRYMLEARASVNNALTSILGNAELLLSECDRLPGSALPRIETIQCMALRLNETMQRFSSLASEFRFAEKYSQGETGELAYIEASAPDAT